VQRRHRSRHRFVHRAPFGRGDALQRVGREHAALELFHQVKRRADDVARSMVEHHSRHRNVGLRERAHNAVLAVDRMRGGQQLAGRLLAQHQRAIVEVDEEGRVRLAADDPRELHRPADVGQRASEERVEPQRIEPERGRCLAHQRRRGRST
jgi:hypothetical protein